ncbi:caspase-2 [Rhipicephalus sanguineus]|uniref:caspase-2 n=1 Tax=Rhipicephalus sanguineus TaxID=34632 RepID=UPI001895BB24|nr:caspase-2 [Rhipicephalus sanguineus]
MKKKLLEAAQSKEHEEADCLVVILMSHGNQGAILGTDIKEVHLVRDVYTLFNNEECPALQGKPKLFFIQACRGEKSDNGTAAIAHDTTDAGKIGPELPQSSPSTKPERVVTRSDMCIVYATIYGYEALKNSVIGSWFLSAVYEVFSEHAGTMHLEELMHHVQDKVMSRSSHDGGKQTCSVVLDGWRKHLYFNPGYAGDCRPDTKTV